MGVYRSSADTEYMPCLVCGLVGCDSTHNDGEEPEAPDEGHVLVGSDWPDEDD